MIIKLFLFIFIIFLLLQVNSAFAHSGRTNASGCHNCNTGYCAGTYHCHNGGYTPPAPTYTPPPKPTCPNNSTLKNGDCVCNYGYAPSGKSCIKIPTNAHIAPIGNLTDAWICDEGYEEIGNSCVLKERPVEKTVIENKEVEHTTNTMDDYTVSDVNSPKNYSENNDKTNFGELISTIILLGLGGTGWYAVKKNNQQFK